MKTTEEMIRINKEQAKFYDAIQSAEADSGHGGYAKNESANFWTAAWASLRYRQQDAVRQAGVESRVRSTHDRWVADKAGGDFMELGCFSESPSTFLLVQAAGSYLGVDLSPKAVNLLNEKFAARGLAHKASAQAVDFLTMNEERKFDLIYAHGVLHHFENSEPLFAKLAALLRPDGVLLLVEPSAVNPVYRIIRTLYRPFQSDAAWEWPFQQLTVDLLERRFSVKEGFGWGCWSLPLSISTGLPLLGRWLTKVYVYFVGREIAKGWHPKVWHNSMVTACYRKKSQ